MLKHVGNSFTCISTESPILCKTYSHWSPSHTPNFSAFHPAIPEIQKRNAHMPMCNCTLWVQLHVHTYLASSFEKFLANGPLTTYQISAQLVKPFPRYERGVRTCSYASPLPYAKSLASGSLIVMFTYFSECL